MDKTLRKKSIFNILAYFSMIWGLFFVLVWIFYLGSSFYEVFGIRSLFLSVIPFIAGVIYLSNDFMQVTKSLVNIIKRHPRVLLALFSITLALVISLKIWSVASWWEGEITSADGWYSDPELSRMEVRDAYNLAFKKIILLGGFIFTSTFLLLIATDKKQ